MIWTILIIVLWLLAEGAVPKINRNILFQDQIPKISLICRWGLILTLTLMVGFWGIVAEDHEEYVIFYHSLSGYRLSDLIGNVTVLLTKQATGMELGYNIINVIGHYLNLKAPLFLTLIALFVNICVVKFIYDYSHPVLSLFLLLSKNFFLMEANLVRQMLAMAIFLISIKPLLEGKWKYFLILIFVAALFHTSAIILGVFIIFLFPKTDKLQNIALIALITTWIVSILIMFGFVSINFLSLFSDSAYSIYATGNNSIGMEVSPFNIAVHNLIVIALLFCFKSFKVNLRLVYYAVIIATTSLFNMSYNFVNILRFTSYFEVVFYIFTIYIFQKSEKWKIGQQSIPIIFLQIYCGLRIFMTFILEDNIFGSESYLLADFF